MPAKTEAKAPAPPTPQAPDLPQALVLSLASFAPFEKGKPPQALPARMEFLAFRDGKWQVSTVEDEGSDVFHKAMHYQTADGQDRILSVAGSAAQVKLWAMNDGKLSAQTLWEKDFGGKFSRMRDVEVGDLFGDGRASMAVATHDQGVVATLAPGASGQFEVVEIDAEPDTFVHEIELGDIDGDGMLEVYSTPSEPNRLDGSPQSGQVTRYVPKTGEGRSVVADLGDRHAKEIYVGDVDGNGKDELYVVVEGRLNKETGSIDVKTEIRRYEADTDPKAGVVIGELPDYLCRFLTVGDIDGDGKKEMVAAAYGSGLWLLRPGDDPEQRWRVESLDKNSGGFEHAAILTDLDGDGRDELYVASDKHKVVRRYAWNGARMVPETIYTRPKGEGGVFTWNIMPLPTSLVP
ncbi:MAG: VCBS repeat-containing protein [bacterium]|nr:VCBS repeat-containing protein [bacterium]